MLIEEKIFILRNEIDSLRINCEYWIEKEKLYTKTTHKWIFSSLQQSEDILNREVYTSSAEKTDNEIYLIVKKRLAKLYRESLVCQRFKSSMFNKYKE